MALVAADSAFPKVATEAKDDYNRQTVVSYVGGLTKQELIQILCVVGARSADSAATSGDIVTQGLADATALIAAID